MSRIRSVHPGLFTDEAFVCLSDAAQVFFVGLWTECDDQGAFEWKPVQLRLKLRGNRDGGVEALLAELEAANCIMSYQHEGRKYGLVRNFRRFQRPKKPNSVHFIPPELRTYTGLKADGSEPDTPLTETSSEPVGNQFGTSGEKSPQMEDGGGRMDKEEEGGRERERARKADPDHWKVVEAIIVKPESNRFLDEWEINFLHSIKRMPKLTPTQAERLTSIAGKFAAKAECPEKSSTSGPPVSVWVWKDTPQWEAWAKVKKWPTKEARHPEGGYRPGWYFGSEWPPAAQKPAQEPKATASPATATGPP